MRKYKLTIKFILYLDKSRDIAINLIFRKLPVIINIIQFVWNETQLSRHLKKKCYCNFNFTHKNYTLYCVSMLTQESSQTSYRILHAFSHVSIHFAFFHTRRQLICQKNCKKIEILGFIYDVYYSC